jgi:hypothetical protein
MIDSVSGGGGETFVVAQKRATKKKRYGCPLMEEVRVEEREARVWAVLRPY